MTSHNGIRVKLAPGPRVIGDEPVEAFRLKPQPWTEEALCREVGVELFIPDSGESAVISLAKKVCNGIPGQTEPCPVRDACLEWALEVDDRYAILGGKSPRQRMKLERDRRQSEGLIRCGICDTPFGGGAHDRYCSDPCRLEARRRRNAKKRRTA